MYVSSSSRAAGTDFPDSLQPFVSIIHLLDDTLCPYRAVIDKFLSVVQHLHVREKGSIGERRLWVCSDFTSSIPHVLFV